MINKNKIVVTGGSGRFAQSLKKIKCKYKFIYPKKKELDITNLNSIRKYLKKNKLKVTHINKVKEGSPHIVEKIKTGKIQFVVNTTFGEQSIKDSYSLRRASLTTNIPYYTTIAGSFALLKALRALRKNDMTVTSLQDYGILSAKNS